MDDFKEFFLILRQYFSEQKEYIKLTTAEQLTLLLSAVATVAVLILTMSIVLLLLCMGLSLWIGELTNTPYMGYFILSGAVLLASIIFYIKRRDWVMQPIARLMVKIFVEPEVKEKQS